MYLFWVSHVESCCLSSRYLWLDSLAIPYWKQDINNVLISLDKILHQDQITQDNHFLPWCTVCDSSSGKPMMRVAIRITLEWQSDHNMGNLQCYQGLWRLDGCPNWVPISMWHVCESVTFTYTHSSPETHLCRYKSILNLIKSAPVRTCNSLQRNISGQHLNMT